jgi:hypothetical protein
MENLFESYTNAKGETLNIYYDDYCESPRDYDNISTLILKNIINESHFMFDNNIVYDNEEHCIIELTKDIKKEFGSQNILAICPVWKYEHSGVVFSLSPFSCRFDSGFVGFMVVLKSEARKQLGVKRLSKEKQRQALEYAYSEFKVFNEYAQGNCLRFEVLDKDGNEIDSCGGFYGTDIKTNGLLDYAQGFNEVVNSERLKLVG